MPIHPTAIVDSGAEIDSTAEIGAYAVVENDVQIGRRVKIFHHGYIARGARLAAGVEVHPFAVVSHSPQDFAYKGEPTYAVVGEGTIIREHASIHRGTTPGSSTVVGQRCFLMATAHIAHNCVIGDNVVFANGAMLGGHVHVGRNSFLGGNSMLHQFVRVGAFVMLSAGAKAVTDVAPFMIYDFSGVVGPNVVGLRRAGYTPEERLEVRAAHRLLFRSGFLFRDAVQRLAAMVKTRAGREVLEFVTSPSKRGFAAGHRRRSAAREEITE